VAHVAGRHGAEPREDTARTWYTAQMASTDAPPRMARKALAELLGTFAVVLTAMAVDISYFSGDDVGNAARWLARGFIATVMIYTFSEISGAHFNPAVTVAFVLRRVMSLRLGGVYIVMQCAGALAACGVAWLMFGDRLGLGATRPGPGVSNLTAAGVEVVLTAIVLVTVLITANESKVGKDVALAVGFSIAACGFFAGHLSGASMNPVRSIVPQLLSGRADIAWIYLAGPLGGTVLAVILTYLVWGPPTAKEREAALGDSGG
jgi:aquaporin Z